MRKRRFSAKQISGMLTRIEGGQPLADVRRKVGISDGAC